MPNLNGASIEGLQTNPTPSAVNSAAQSLMATWRSTATGNSQTLTKYGFEIWQIRASNPPSLTQIVSFPQTGGFWSYGGIKNVGVLLNAVDQVAGMTDAQKEGVRGWAKTILAVQYEDMAQAHDTFGIVLDLPDDPLTDVPPIADKTAVWTRIFQLLDQADGHLANAGTSFSFTLGPGYAGFNTPTTFRQVNRALKARYQIVNKDFAAALATLGSGTFINTAPAGLTRAGLQRGPFHTFTTLTGDGTNGLSGTDYYINTRIRDDAQLKAPGGARDDRVALKSRSVTSFTFLGVTSNLKHADFFNTNLTTPTPLTNITSLPIIRNEELILLRAEAKLATGDASGAIADINLIRVNSGGLPAISDPYVADVTLKQPPTLLEELLYEKRMSLWGEIGTVWLDMRRYGMITSIPRYDPSFKLFDIFPIPQAECEVRGYTTRGCFSAGYNGI
ncbi:MAG: RagB/SusD family nutrient uptake outer membrane protein [Gemmatimonadetes bacterium]|nr:RagB/SusD family nutrient uptake outer membrane protein [Gemmatimonadota bacterium]